MEASQLLQTVNKIKEANDRLDKECMVSIKNKLKEMIRYIMYSEEVFFNDITDSKIKVEMANNNIKQEFDDNSISILNAHKKVIEVAGLRYIKAIKVLLHEKTKKSHELYHSFQENKIDNDDNDVRVKEEIIVNNDNNEMNNNSDSENENIIPLQNKIYVAGVNLKCIYCDKLFYFQEDFQSHMDIEHDQCEPYKCHYNQCDKCYNTKASLIAHIERKHENKKNYQCDVCDKQFYCKGDWQIHCRVHTNDRPYKCNQCDKAFKQSGHLDTHIKYKHTNNRPFQCNQCEKSFVNNGDRQNHIRRVHNKERRYECNVCHKQFFYQSNWIVHCRIHTGDKPYQCNECNKSFKSNGELNVHCRIHTGDRPYKCNICQKTFTTSSGMTVHKRIHTGEKTYKCSKCHKRFTQSSSRNTHQKKCKK